MNEHREPQITRSGPSIVWLIPLVTAVVGAWLIARTLLNEVPTATISFRTAQGIEAGKTKVKYKSVDIGVVDDIQFADDFDHVVLTVSFNQGMERFLRRDTRFWVVRPRLSLRGVSGLGTLISGAYIEIDPGGGAPQKHFVGLEQRPPITKNDAGTQILLVTEDLGSLVAGSPVYYQGLSAGEVLGHELGSDARSIYVHAFVRDPFDQLLRGSSRFWNVSGMDISLDANGFEARTASLQALLLGGIAFETPDLRDGSAADAANLVFTLYPSHEQIEAQAYSRRMRFLLYFQNSVRGLAPGAPVEFKGLRIGSVVDIKLELNSDETSFRIPVLIEIEPERITYRAAEAESNALTLLQSLVDKGLRARLAPGNLLTGQLYVDLNMFPERPAVYVAHSESPYPELPTIPGTIAAVTGSIQSLLARIESINIEQIGQDLEDVLHGTDALINAPEDAEVHTDLQAALRALKSVLRQVDNAGVDEVIHSANEALTSLDETLQGLDSLLTPDSPLQYNLIQVTAELEETARSLRALIELLERQPQSVLFGRQHPTRQGNGDD